MKRIFTALAALGLLAACHPPAETGLRLPPPGYQLGAANVYASWDAPVRPDSEKQIIAPFETLNSDFRATYARERAAELAKYDTVILQRFDGLTLFRKGQLVETKRVVPATYHDLRFFPHVAFNVYLKFHRQGEAVDADTIADFKKLRGMIEKAVPEIPKLTLTGPQIERQKKIAALTVDCLSYYINEKQGGFLARSNYVKEVTPLIKLNMNEAAIAQVDGLHAQMRAWKKQFPDADWKNFKVIVHGGQQPRCDHVATQYFAALLKEKGDGRGYPGESRRVIYFEDDGVGKDHPWDPHMNLLAAINLDADAAEAFFGDPDRLAVEAMADGAREYLKNFDFGALR